MAAGKEADDMALVHEINALRQEVIAVNERLKITPGRMLGLQFLRGVAFGLGSFLGATLVVSTLIYSLSSIDFIPIIGEWAARIAEQIRN